MPLFGTTSFPVDYIATLEALFLLKPATVIPGHGPVMRDTVHIEKILALIRSIKFVFLVWDLTFGLEVGSVRSRLGLATTTPATGGGEKTLSLARRIRR